MIGFLSERDLEKFGFKSVGVDVLISEKASIYEPEKMVFGNHVRIDDFCILTGNIRIGDYVHIGSSSALYGKFGIDIGDFSGVSCRVILLSATDDFTGEYLSNSPVIPQQYCKTTGGPITLKKFVNIGAGAIVFPDLVLAEGTAVGSMTLVNMNTREWSVYFGIPAKKISTRKKEMIKYAKLLKEDIRND